MQKLSVISNSPLIIDPSQIATKISSQDKQTLTCLICLGIVIDPIQCMKCETLFCQKQLQQDGSYKNCPICKVNAWKKGSQIHRSYKSKLFSLGIVCNIHQDCKGKQFPYDKYLQHMKVQESPVSEVVSEKQYYQFYYLMHEDDWQEYSPESNTAANLYFQHKINEFSLGNYRIDIKAMKQTNTNTGYQRRIKMEVVKDRKPCPFWTIDVDGNEYEPYDQKSRAQLQEGYTQFLKGKSQKIRIKIKQYLYEIDFLAMEQVNIITKTARKIKRTVI